jgi:hypothetical protein
VNVGGQGPPFFVAGGPVRKGHLRSIVRCRPDLAVHDGGIDDLAAILDCLVRQDASEASNGSRTPLDVKSTLWVPSAVAYPKVSYGSSSRGAAAEMGWPWCSRVALWGGR